METKPGYGKPPQIDWKPIETAPKNKNILIAYVPEGVPTQWCLSIAEWDSGVYWVDNRGYEINGAVKYWSELPNNPE